MGTIKQIVTFFGSYIDRFGVSQVFRSKRCFHQR